MWNIHDFQHLKLSLKKRVSSIETADYFATVFFKSGDTIIYLINN